MPLFGIASLSRGKSLSALTGRWVGVLTMTALASPWAGQMRSSTSLSFGLDEKFPPSQDGFLRRLKA